MSAGCAACGDCCDPVMFTRVNWEYVTAWTATALDGVPDPATDEGWDHWVRSGWPDGEGNRSRENAIHMYRADGTYREDAEFIAAHWSPIDDGTCACDQFDPGTRLCGARESRPPVCRGFPWYGRDPGPDHSTDLGDRLSHCSYLTDLPPSERPEGSRPLIPLTAIHHPLANAA